MKMNRFKKLNISLLAFMVAISNVTAFADANVIYAPTTAPSISLPPAENHDYVSPSSSTIVSSEQISTVPNYIVGSIDYNNIYHIVEHNNNYYCYENGDIVRNGWRKISRNSYGLIAPVDNFSYSYIWAYFTSNGSALKGSSGAVKRARIGDHTYSFNEYGQLMTGFFNESGEMWNEASSEDPFDLLNDGGTLYHSAENSGVMTTGWYRLNTTTSRYPNKNVIWLYFSPSNFKITRATGNNYKRLTVDGKTYAFDDNGVMLTGFEAVQYNEAHGGSTKVVYYGEDGAEIRSGFYNVDLSDEDAMERYSEYEDYDEDITIYLSKNGVVYRNMIKKINSNYYGFDENGVLLKGLTVWNNGNYIATIETEDTVGKDFIMSGTYSIKNGGSGVLSSSDTLHYFDSRGKRITNAVKLEFSDSDYTYAASSQGGYNGTHNSKYYVNGLLIKPESGVRYGVYIVSPTKRDYTMSELVNTTNIIITNNGSVISSKSAQKDDDDNYWLISSKSLINIYSVPVKVTNGSYYFKSTNKNGNDTWIKFGEKDEYGRTCVTEVLRNGTKVSGGAISDYQERLSADSAINFNIR